MWRSNWQKAVGVLLILAATTFAVPASQASERWEGRRRAVVEAVQSQPKLDRSFWGQLWTALSRLWSKSGMMVDPSGATGNGGSSNNGGG